MNNLSVVKTELKIGKLPFRYYQSTITLLIPKNMSIGKISQFQNKNIRSLT